MSGTLKLMHKLMELTLVDAFREDEQGKYDAV